MTSLISLSPTKNRRADKWRIVLALALKDITDSVKNKTILTLIISLLFVVLMFRFLPRYSKGSEMNVLVYYAAPAETVLNAIVDSDQLELLEGYETAAQMQNRLAGAELTEIGLVLPADLEVGLARGDRPEITAYVPYWISDAEAQRAKALVEEELAFWTGREIAVNLESTPVYLDMETDGLDVTISMTMIYVLTIVGVSLVPNLMVEEKRSKTLDALLVSPATPGLITAGKALSGLFYALVGAAIVLAMYGALILNWPLAILAVVLGGLFCIPLGLILGTLIDNQQQLQILAWAFLIPLLLGFFLNLMSDLFPAILGRILYWIPTVSMARLLKVAMLPEIPWRIWTVDLLYLAALSALLFGAVVWLLRRRDR